MRFAEIQMKNFRQYEDVTLSLVQDTNQYLIAEAGVGRGKTTFSNALLWCLYGEEGAPANEPLVNSGVVASSTAGANVSVVVKLKIELDDGSVANLTREQVFVAIPDGGQPLDRSSLSAVHMKDRRVGANPVQNAQAWVQKILPKRLYPYFIFNGEHAADHFSKHTKVEVRDAILGIARVDVLQRMKSHLEKVQEEIRGEAKRLDPDGLGIADSRVQTLTSRLTELEEEINRIAGEIEDFDSRNSDLKDRLERSGKLREQLAQRDAAGEIFSRAETELQENEQGLAHWAGTSGPLAFSLRALDDLGSAVEASKNAGTFPPDFQAPALKRLLDQGACICGRHLDDSDSKGHVENLISDFEKAGPRGAEMQKLDKELARFQERLENSRKNHKELTLVRGSIIDDLTRSKSELERLNSEVGGLEASEDVKLWDELQTLVNLRTTSEVNLSLLRVEREQVVRDQAKATADFNQLLGQSERARKLQASLLFLDEAIVAIGDVYDNILARVRENLGRELGANYEKWHSKATNDGIVLSEDFSIHKIDQFGNRSSFSQGEYRLVYYALCIALRGVSGFRFPFIVDSPWGNLDNTIRDNLATSITAQVSDYQTALFMLDSENPPEVAKLCKAGEPRMMAIEMIDSEGIKRSTIEPMGV